MPTKIMVDILNIDYEMDRDAFLNSNKYLQSLSLFVCQNVLVHSA